MLCGGVGPRNGFVEEVAFELGLVDSVGVQCLIGPPGRDRTVPGVAEEQPVK